MIQLPHKNIFSSQQATDIIAHKPIFFPSLSQLFAQGYTHCSCDNNTSISQYVANFTRLEIFLYIIVKYVPSFIGIWFSKFFCMVIFWKIIFGRDLFSRNTYKAFQEMGNYYGIMVSFKTSLPISWVWFSLVSWVWHKTAFNGIGLLLDMWSCSLSLSAGAVEYTDCFSTEG